MRERWERWERWLPKARPQTLLQVVPAMAANKLPRIVVRGIEQENLSSIAGMEPAILLEASTRRKFTMTVTRRG